MFRATDRCEPSGDVGSKRKFSAPSRDVEYSYFQGFFTYGALECGSTSEAQCFAQIDASDQWSELL